MMLILLSLTISLEISKGCRYLFINLFDIFKLHFYNKFIIKRFKSRLMDKDAITDLLQHKAKVNAYISQSLENNSGKRKPEQRKRHGYFEK